MADIIEKLFREDFDRAMEEGFKEGLKIGRLGILYTLINKGIISAEDLSKKLDIPLSELELMSSSH